MTWASACSLGKLRSTIGLCGSSSGGSAARVYITGAENISAIAVENTKARTRRSAAQPESVEADWPRTGCLLDALNTLLIRDALFFRSHGELCGPGLPVSGCFVATLNDLFCERRVQVHRCTDHMGCDLDLAPVKD